MPGSGWYLLVHQLPARPIYLRAKIGHRLSRAGALALKNSVYVLPRNRQSLENLQSIVGEARVAGGEAFVCEAEFIDGITSDALTQRFRDERDGDYDALAAQIRDAGTALDRRDGVRSPQAELLARLTRLSKRLSEIQTIDFFDAPQRRTSEALLTSLETRLLATRKGAQGERSRGEVPSFKSRVWATRRGIHIDRIGSAWLIRRFIDPDARFRFIDPKEEPRPGELRFDMVGGDFTHEGDSCTFETLVRLVRDPDPALRHVAEIVHDIDLKDGKFERSDAAGVQQVMLGIVLSSPDDRERLKRGFALFDDLYASFRKRHALTKEARK